MVNIQAYDQQLAEVSTDTFLKKALDYDKIMDVSGYERTKGFALCFTTIAERAGITDPINNLDKKEIQELILRRFKRLSFQEILFCFKMERQLELGEPIQHYNKFTVTYVAMVLTRYLQWKSAYKMRTNLPAFKELPEPEISQEEKDRIVAQGLMACYDYFIEHGEIEDGRMYVYDLLYEMGKLPTDGEIKKKYYQEAKEVIKHIADTMAPKNRAEKDYQSELYRKLERDRDATIIVAAKKISIKKFFRSITREKLLNLEINLKQ